MHSKKEIIHVRNYTCQDNLVACDLRFLVGAGCNSPLAGMVTTCCLLGFVVGYLNSGSPPIVVLVGSNGDAISGKAQHVFKARLTKDFIHFRIG
jgi:hypothetical protein